jgi:hypothetical protein
MIQNPHLPPPRRYGAASNPLREGEEDQVFAKLRLGERTAPGEGKAKRLSLRR